MGAHGEGFLDVHHQTLEPVHYVSIATAVMEVIGTSARHVRVTPRSSTPSAQPAAGLAVPMRVTPASWVDRTPGSETRAQLGSDVSDDRARRRSSGCQRDGTASTGRQQIGRACGDCIDQRAWRFGLVEQIDAPERQNVKQSVEYKQRSRTEELSTEVNLLTRVLTQVSERVHLHKKKLDCIATTIELVSSCRGTQQFRGRLYLRPCERRGSAPYLSQHQFVAAPGIPRREASE